MAADKFIKITEEFLDDWDWTKRDLPVSERVATWIQGHSADHYSGLLDSLIDCESPIEQLFSIELFQCNPEQYCSLFNPNLTIFVTKQKEVVCGKKKYRLDFSICAHNWKQNKDYLFDIECDGHDFHQKTKKQVEGDNTRARRLQKYGYEIIRFSGSEIYAHPGRCAKEALRIVISKAGDSSA